MDIAGLAPRFNYTLYSLLDILPEVTYPGMILLLYGSTVGTIGNIMIISAVFLFKNLRHIGNLFVVNMAIADLCITVIIDPLGIIGVTQGEIYFAERPALCQFVASTCLTACYCSLLSIASVAVNRYIFICHNASYARLFSRCNTVCLCIVVWVVSFFLNFSNFVGWGNFIYDRKNFACVWNRMAARSYTIFFTCCAIVVPSLLVIYCYCRIFNHVTRTLARTRKLRLVPTSPSGENRAGASLDSIRLAKTLFIVFAAFALCWVPYAIMVTLDWNDSFPIHLHAYAVIVAHTNSALNFIVYGVTNKEFRMGYRLVCVKLLRFVTGNRWSPQVSVAALTLAVTNTDVTRQ